MKFSIITPSYDQGLFIGQCLESVHGQLEQSREGPAFLVEHLIMDGGSRDTTRAVLEKWKPGSFPEKYSFSFVSEPDSGQTNAINKGLGKATGDILAYLCSDDFYEPSAFRAAAEIFERRPEVDIVYGDYFFLEGDSGWKRLKKTGEFSRERLLKDNFLGQPAVFWRRRVYEKFGPLDEKLHFCMDHEYWLRISRDSTWYYLEQPLAVSRLQSSAKTSTQLTRAWWETAAMAKRYGQGSRFYRKALAMQITGQYLYLFKRWVFRKIGRFLSNP